MFLCRGNLAWTVKFEQAEDDTHTLGWDERSSMNWNPAGEEPVTRGWEDPEGKN